MDRATTIRPLLDLAIRMADRADELSVSGFFSYFDIEHKEDGSPVTSVDRRIESDLRRLISVAHPEAGIVGEEMGSRDGDGRWIIDPIDGTVEFVEGDPRFATLIAYERDGETLVGVVSAPALGLRWWAGRGLGAHVRREGATSASRVSIVSNPSRARALVPRDALARLDAPTPEARAALGWAEAGIGLVPYGPSWQAVRVASGDYDLAVARGRLWDVAPLPVIVAEAGGGTDVLSDDGGRITLDARNRQLTAAIVAGA